MNAFTLGLITDNGSSEHPGKVHVSLPCMSKEASDLGWIPVMSPWGLFWTPEVGESVVVGFLDDDRSEGFVLGSLINHQMSGEKSGHTINFADGNGENLIALKTAGGLMVELSDNGRKITMKGQNLKLEGNDISIEGSAVSIKSAGILTLKGSLIKIN